MQPFVIYPTIDLRDGQVVRLQQGDPDRQTTYSSDPAATARRWLDAGAVWLHVVNLDGAFGERDDANRRALQSILEVADDRQARVQLGGGLRSLEALQQGLEMGVARAVLGTLAVEEPDLLATCLQQYGPDRVAVGIDARQGRVRTRGWKTANPLDAHALAIELAKIGLEWIIFTDIARDGTGAGLNLPATVDLARQSRLQVIASGGVDELAEIHAARDAGLAGVIVGRALYEQRLIIPRWVDERKPPGACSG